MRVVTGSSVTTQACTTVAPMFAVKAQSVRPWGVNLPLKRNFFTPIMPKCAAIAAQVAASGCNSKLVLFLFDRSPRRIGWVGNSANGASILELGGLHDVEGIKGMSHQSKGQSQWAARHLQPRDG